MKRKKEIYCYLITNNYYLINESTPYGYLIDIEGAKYCDVGEELSFLDMRFNKILKEAESGVDEQRMFFYYIGHCMGNLRGALELRQKGY